MGSAKHSQSVSPAKELREFFQELIHNKLKTKTDREQLAQALGLTISAIEAMTYRGVGSFETFAGALLHLYQIDLEALKSHVLKLKNISLKKTPSRESEKVWYELDKELSEPEKAYWVHLIRAATRINLVLAEKRKSRKAKP